MHCGKATTGKTNLGIKPYEFPKVKPRKLFDVWR